MITRVKDKFLEQREWPQLFECKLEHEIKSTVGTFAYIGPPIGRDAWHGAMSFLRYAYERVKGEAQLRWYVNLKRGEWRAWAYPQKSSVGLHTEELRNGEFKKQRAQFDQDWLYFGTLHSHADAGAFQSGTDENNECDQDGIHITVGKMADSEHDLHARVYLGQLKFEPDLARFWDIGKVLQDLLPRNLWSNVAKHQMTRKVEAKFPDQWKQNLIEVKTAVTYTYGGVGTWNGNGQGEAWDWKKEKARKALDKVIAWCTAHNVDNEELVTAMEILSEENEPAAIIFRECREEFCTIDDFIEAWNDQVEQHRLKKIDPQKQIGPGSVSSPATGETWTLGYGD